MTTQLDGLCILNTRPHDEASLLTQQIQDAGGVVIALPTLEIKCPTTPPILPDLTTIDHAIFVSPHAVSHFFKTFSPLYWPSSIKLFALGEGTKKKLLSMFAACCRKKNPAC